MKLNTIHHVGKGLWSFVVLKTPRLPDNWQLHYLFPFCNRYFLWFVHANDVMSIFPTSQVDDGALSIDEPVGYRDKLLVMASGYHSCFDMATRVLRINEWNRSRLSDCEVGLKDQGARTGSEKADEWFPMYDDA